MGFILNIVASILKWILQPFMFIFGTIISLNKKEFNDWQLDLAYTKDVWGNVLIKYVADIVLIKKDGYPFGNRKRTISYVLGVNKKYDKLTVFGKILVWILNKIDKNHVEKAI